MAEQRLPYRTPQVPRGFGTIHWPSLIAGLLGLVFINVCGTQFIAYRFDYAPALGVPITRIGQIAIYRPWMWVLWFLHYTNSQVPYVKNTVGFAILGIVLACIVVVVGFIVSNFRRTRKVLEGAEDLHGSARFADADDLKRNGALVTKTGVYIGGFRDKDYLHYLRHDGPEHVLAAAPTRSGKGVGLVIPTLLGWEQSVIVYDIKGENWALTSGYRAKELKQTCLKFSPLEKDTAHFNPFDLIRFGTEREVADTRNIAEMLLDTGDTTNDRYFLDEAVTLASALILHLLYEARRMNYASPSPGNLLDIATDAKYGLQQLMEIIKTYPHRTNADAPFPGIEDPTLTTHPIVASTMSAMLLKGDKEFGSVVGSLTRPLQVYADPLVRSATSRSDFTVHDLVTKPVSLYLVIPPSDKLRLKPLVRIFFTMAVNRLTERMDFQQGGTKKNPYKLLFLIDEFASLGKMQIFADALSYMGGYGLKAYVIIQDFQQLYDAYGQYEAIVSNCHVRIAYAPNNQKTAQLLSEMTGKTTIQHATVNFSGQRTASAHNQMSTSIQFVERELMTASEITGLKKPTKEHVGTPNEKIIGPGDMLIFLAGEHPIYGVQILYFLDPEFRRRSQIEPPAAESHALVSVEQKRLRPRATELPGAAAPAPVVTEIIPIPKDAHHFFKRSAEEGTFA
jgi:type IV secretion system protein VirD4